MNTNDSSKPVAVATGANRGLGFAAVEGLARRDYRVVLVARDAQKAKDSCSRLVSDGLDVCAQAADVSAPETLVSVAEQIGNQYGRLDSLVNNAGIMPEDDQNSSVFVTPFDLIEPFALTHWEHWLPHAHSFP